MPLFEVKGWNVNATKVVEDKGESKSLKKKEKREKRRREREEATGASRLKKSKVETEDDETTTDAVTEDNETQLETKPLKKLKKSKDSDESASTQAPAPAPAKLTPLQQKMLAKLSGSRFRWINEQLYTTTSEAALDLITKQPELFEEYHTGFREQVKLWPENPVEVFVNQVKLRAKKPVNAPGGLPGMANKEVVIADMGCGEAQLAQDVAKFVRQQKGKRRTNITVHSFDLKKQNKYITVADIKNVPLEDELCSIVVFSLALMGTNFLDFINEAHRILAPRGELWIAEIKSRFADDNGDEFVEALKHQGFFHKHTDNDNKMFTRFEFFKPSADIVAEREARLQRKKKFIERELDKEEFDKKRQQRPEGEWLLKPCIYKRR